MNQIREVRAAIAAVENQGDLFALVNEFVANVEICLGLNLEQSYETAAKVAYDDGRPEIGEVLVDAFHRWIALDDRDQARQ